MYNSYMKVNNLIRALENLDKDKEIMILDGSNGGGFPREINVGPIEAVITDYHEKECADCEGKIGETVYILGYGCY